MFNVEDPQIKPGETVNLSGSKDSELQQEKASGDSGSISELPKGASSKTGTVKSCILYALLYYMHTPKFMEKI